MTDEADGCPSASDGHHIWAKPLPLFDEEAARGLDEYEVRRRWPRTDNICKLCGTRRIQYASVEHYILGDW